MATPLSDCSLPDTHTLLERLRTVLSDPHSAGHEGRHMVLLETYLRQTGDRLLLADVGALSETLVHFMGRAEVYGRYRDVFGRVTGLLKRPPLMVKASDELRHPHTLVGLYNTVGCFLLQTKNDELKPHLLEIIENIVEGSSAADDTPLAVRVTALEQSYLTECLADFIAVEGADLYLAAVDAAHSICSRSEVCCRALVKKDFIETILIRLASARESDREHALDVTYQLLWRLLKCPGHVTAPSRPALRAHRYVLRREALLFRKSLCNVAAVTLLMIHVFPHADYVLSGLFEDIVFSATMTEAVFEELLKIMPHFKSNGEYLQFKRLMLACLCVLPADPRSVDLLRQYRVAECLVAMLHGGSVTGVPVRWAPADLADLYSAALHTVSALYPHLARAFMDARLMARLIQHVQHFKVRNPPDELTLTTLKMILLLCAHEKEADATREAFREANAVYILLHLCEKIVRFQGVLTIYIQSILSKALCAVSLLMENMEEIQNKHAGTCLCIQSALYKRILHPMPDDSLLDNRLVVAAGNFVWKVIVRNRESALEFIRSGEIYSHIDILERGSFSTQLVYLSVLVELCETEQSVPYLVTWRGRGGVKLFSVLCGVWRAEERRLGVPRTDRGCIADIERPLMGEEQFKLSKRRSTITAPCDVLGSARPKVYAVVQLLQRHGEAAALCEEHYRLGHAMLPHEDEVTLRLAEAYLPLKMGEVWWEVRETQHQGRALPVDRYLADTLADRYLDWALRVQRAQGAVLEQHDGRLRREEDESYGRARAARLTEALGALREVVAIARSADRALLLETHRRAMEAVHRSRARAPAGPVQATYSRDLPVLMVDSRIDLVTERDVVTVTPI